eukprot:m.320874 g.320874  ORF g.320874 m.320874 type:complete len:199 (-) comp55511_c0_seq9:324-920(-)
MLRDEQQPAPVPADPFNSIKDEVQREVVGTVLRAGQESAQKLIVSYWNVDWFRPYFDVDPATVRARLIASVWPRRYGAEDTVGGDLYGPLMLAFTLIAVILFDMKQSDHQPERNGSLMGTAFAVAFGYWWTLSAIAFSLVFIFNSTLTIVQLLSITVSSLTRCPSILFVSLRFAQLASIRTGVRTVCLLSDAALRASN